MMRSRSITAVWTVLAVGGVALLLALAPPAAAQTEAERLRRQIELLQSNLESLRVQFQEVQRFVFAEGGARPVASTAPASSAPAGESGDIISHRLAVVESRLDQLDQNEMRKIKGEFDELRNLLERMDARIEKLVADVDFRLTALESSPPVGGRESAPPVAAIEGETPLESGGGATSNIDTDEGYQPSGAPRILGTIPLEEGVVEPVAEEPQPTARAVILPEGSPEDRYKYALGILRKARYDEAAAVLDAFMQAHAGHPLVENAAYWHGETFYARKMFGEAARIYATNLQNYPAGGKAPDNMVKLGMSLANLGRPEEACQAFEELARKFSDMPANVRRAAERGRKGAGCA
jgi:tol-pal system protein YbgF